MTAPTQEQPPTTVAATAAGVAVGVAAAAVAVEQIRLLYLTATHLTLHALRRAVTTALADPDDRDRARWWLHRTITTAAQHTAQQAAPRIRAVIRDAQHAGAATADADLGPTTSTPPEPADTDLRATRATPDPQLVAPAVDAAYRQTIDRAFTDEPDRPNRRRVAQRALDDFAARGVRVFRDRAGREWDIASYVEMAVRTTAARAQTDAYTARLLERGVGLVRVSHVPDCCPRCAPYDGKTLAIGPDSDGRAFATLAEARAAGFGHPNCRHRLFAYTSPIPRQRTPPNDPISYQQRQRLRYLERRVRAARRREAVALDPAAARAAAAEVRAAHAAIRDHIARTGLTRQRHRERITKAR